MNKETLKEMFDNLLHIGNKTNYWNPKMKGYIHGSTNGVHIINLVKTVEQIEGIKTQLQELNAAGKKVLFVATKLQARDAFKKLAVFTKNYYVCEKWVPGLLTNFKTIRKRINTYIKLQKDSESGAFDVLTKKEKAGKMLELEKLDKAFNGLKEMRKLPDVIFVVDGTYEQQAVKEAKTLGLTSFAISNTNGNPDVVTDLIPANTNSVKSIDYLAELLKDGFKAPAKKPAPKVAPKEETSSEDKKTPVKKTETKKTVEVKKEVAKKAPVKKVDPKKTPVKKTEEK